MAEDAHIDVIDAVAAVLVERAYVATQAQFGVDDIATHCDRCRTIAHEPLVGRRLGTDCHGRSRIEDADNARLTLQGNDTALGSDGVHRDGGRRNTACAGRVGIGHAHAEGLAWRAGRQAKDEVITLGVVAQHAEVAIVIGRGTPGRLHRRRALQGSTPTPS